MIDYDIDVVYFDRDNQQESLELRYEQELIKVLPQYVRSVTNQPRMEIYNNVTYKDTKDAISKYPETATASGIMLTDNDQVLFYNKY